MSLAENLLNSLSTENISQDYSANEEEHIIVDSSRRIIIPAKLKMIAVTGDKDIETVTIDCVRYWNNHDLSNFAVYINYMLPNGETGTYIPENITRYDDYFSFDWVIGRNITKYNGSLSFLILTRQVDDNGNLIYQWSSLLNGEFTISKGLENINVPEEEFTQDVVSQILQNLNLKVSYHDILNTTGYYQNKVMSQKTTTEELNKRSNALVGKASGEIVAMDDVSPLEHKIPVKLRSKNIIPYPYLTIAENINGTTVTVNGDGTITMQDTPTVNGSFALCRGVAIPKGKYYFSMLPSTVTGSTMYAYVKNEKTQTNYYDNGAGVDFEFKEDTTITIAYVFATNWNGEAVTLKPQLEKGTKKTPYTRFLAGKTQITVKSYVDNVEYETVTTTIAEGAELTSISPYMEVRVNDIEGTFLEGVVIDCAYNRDINIVLEKVHPELVAPLEFATFELLGNGASLSHAGFFSYKKGMTWREFVESEYNPIQYEDVKLFSIDGDIVLCYGWGQIYGSNTVYTKDDSDYYPGMEGRPKEWLDVLANDVIIYPYYCWPD